MDEYIPLEECKHGYVYKVDARNFHIGVFDSKRNWFIGIRYKWGDSYLDEEYHWDFENGTARPLEEIEKLPGGLEIVTTFPDPDNTFFFLDIPEYPMNTCKINQLLFDYLEDLDNRLELKG